MGTVILIFILFFVVFNIIPKYPYIKVSKATGLINEGKYEEGLELFSKVLKNKNVDFMTKIRYVFTELKFGSLTKAKEGISYILAEPKLARGIRYEAKAVFALILYKEGSLDDAKELMSEVYENYKGTGRLMNLKSLVGDTAELQYYDESGEGIYLSSTDFSTLSGFSELPSDTLIVLRSVNFSTHLNKKSNQKAYDKAEETLLKILNYSTN